MIGGTWAWLTAATARGINKAKTQADQTPIGNSSLGFIRLAIMITFMKLNLLSSLYFSIGIVKDLS